MNRVLNFAVVAMSAVIMTSSRVDAAVVNITEGSTSGYTMTDGNTYVIQNSVSFSNSTTGGSGMSVEDGATVVLYIPVGVTLTVTGRNGDYHVGGGAGISVPEMATLVITGEGTVKATGGAAGNGGNGRAGENARSYTLSGTETVYAGPGGYGGSGGGGAGAGIGGCGGSTGNGESMGNVYVLGSINVIAYGGKKGSVGSSGRSGSMVVDHRESNYYYASGGGGGGGGGGGYAPTCSIGGGGAAGADGGKGSSGSITRVYNSTCPAGATGSTGGMAGQNGGAGYLYVSSAVILSVEREKFSVATHHAAQYTITLDANGGQFTSEIVTLTATLGCELPNCIPSPTKGGYIFEGWRTAADEEYYGASGAKSKSSYTATGNVTLYAQWRLDEKCVVSGNAFWLRENAETGWFVDPDVDEGSVLRSGEIGNSTSSWMEATIVGPLSISFDWKVSCNMRGHYLAWLIDGVEQARIRGEVDWATVAATIPEGEHIVRFDYVKGSTAAAGEDKGQVRNFTMGLRVETDTMQVLWDWTTNYWVECSIVGKGTITYEAQWVAEGTNLVIPFSVNTPFYSLTLSGDADGAVLGDGSITVPITAPRSIVLHVTEYTYEAALDGGRLSWTSGGAANWIPQVEVSHDGQDAVRSGEVTGDDVSTLSTVVVGPGTLSWWWKLDMVDCAGVDVFVDGAFVESLDSASDWTSASVDIVGNGEHVVRFEFWNAGTAATITDCAYLDQVSWTGGTVDHTVTTPDPVPYSYFDMNCPTLLAEYGGDYEATAFATALNGRNKVWECYVAGISPTNETARFTAAIEMVDGVPQITWSPNLNTNGIERTYTIWGKTNLTDGVEWECPTNSAHRFFKVKVEMP